MSDNEPFPDALWHDEWRHAWPVGVIGYEVERVDPADGDPHRP